jgi:hypothetical protein
VNQIDQKKRKQKKTKENKRIKETNNRMYSLRLEIKPIDPAC